MRTLLIFEVPSSAEWQPPGSDSPFAPNWFGLTDISATLKQKLSALDAQAEELPLVIKPVDSHPARAGVVITTGETREAAMALAEEVVESVVISTH